MLLKNNFVRSEVLTGSQP